MASEYASCTLCPRACSVDRTRGGRGRCRGGDVPRLARAALHFWEEPCISGEGGSGTVFFSGCPLGCIFCQNREIALARHGDEVSEERLSDIFLELAAAGAENINLVTGTPFIPSIKRALASARARGLSLPIVWNTGGYEGGRGLALLSGEVSVYLTDFKYASSSLAERYACAPDYPDTAMQALLAMVRDVGEPRFDARGMLVSGVLVRFLLLPGSLLDAKAAICRVYRALGDRVLYSLMRQYTPPPDMPPPLDRTVSCAEYASFLRYASHLGIRRGYTQDKESISESFIPLFDLTGVHPID